MLTIRDDNPGHICRRGRNDKRMSILVSLTQAVPELKKKRKGKSYQEEEEEDAEEEEKEKAEGS